MKVTAQRKECYIFLEDIFTGVLLRYMKGKGVKTKIIVKKIISQMNGDNII